MDFIKSNINKLKNLKMTYNIVFILSFLIPIFIMIGIYIGRGIYPFGENCFLRTDMYHQYAPFFSEFYHKLKNNESMFYSWNIGLGVNFTALYAYYLASPLNFLIYLCPKDNIIEFMSILIIFRIGFSSLAFSIYASKHFNTKNLSIIIFSLFYGLSSYIAAYSWNIMWLDCIMLLPLIVLGLERLVKEDKCILYCISLGFAIMSNYYISIMICIFLVFYFFGLMFSLDIKMDRTQCLKKFWNFGFFSLLAGGFAAVLILPEFFALQLTSSGDIDFPDKLSTYFKLFDAFTRHLMNVETSVLSGNYPNIYCGLLVVIMLPLYAMNKFINSKEKIFKILLLLLLIVSFNMNIPNFIWHGFHFPNSLPCRQSFIYIFLVLAMSYEAFRRLEYYTDKEVYGTIFTVVCFILLAEKLADNYDFSIIYLSLLFVIIYLIIIYAYRSPNIKRGITIIIFIAVSVAEASINMEATSVSTTSRVNYLKDTPSIYQLTENIMNKDKDFYRIEKLYRRTKNDTSWHNLRGVSLFSSTASEPVTQLLGDLGFMHSTNAYSYEGSTPFTTAIFNVKYLIDKKENDSNLLELEAQDGETYIYKNNYSLPLGFLVNHELETLPSIKNNPFAMQNDFINRAIEGDSIFFPLETSMSDDTTTIYNDKPQHVFIYIQSSNVEKIKVEYDDNSTEYDLDKKQQIVDLGLFEANKIIDVSNVDDKSLKIIAYGFNENNFKQAYDKLNQNPFEIEYFNSTTIKGKINASEDGMMFTSIPYDEGWSIKVDSIEVEPIAFRKALISVNLSKGEHDIEFNYVPKGLKVGGIISASSVVLLLFSIIIKRMPKSKKQYR